YLVFFGLPQLGLRFDGTWSVLIALGANATAYMIEVFRSGLLSIPSGQYHAAEAQGMRYHQVQLFVILPQVIRNVYESYGNICVGILLGSSLASVVSVNDLSHWMFQTGSDTFRYMETFLVCAGIYVVLAQLITGLRALLRRHLFASIP
ncbi:MAG: amino acid ABC transporter permease, partial [Parvibaculaceae bacterium]